MNLLTVDDSSVAGMVACQSAADIAIEVDLGYNCMVTADSCEIQAVHYLTPINYSPTSYAIVNETLIIANEIAEE